MGMAEHQDRLPVSDGIQRRVQGRDTETTIHQEIAVAATYVPGVGRSSSCTCGSSIIMVASSTASIETSRRRRAA